MSGKGKLVSGVGINDADYPVTIRAMIGGKRVQLWMCPFYQAWAAMLARAYGERIHKLNPTYEECSVFNDWHRFSVFREWMSRQDHNGMDLDKDILSPGNKVYSPNTCVFVSRQLNTFIVDCGACRGKWPIGVSWHKKLSKFRAYCRNPFTAKHEHLGLFACPSEAHEAWRNRKHQIACAYAEMQTDIRVASALRTRYAGERE